MIVSPLGEILAGPEVDGEAIVRAELDLGKIAEGNYDFDVVGHYARPDVFRLSVNEQPSRPSSSRGDDRPVHRLGEAEPTAGAAAGTGRWLPMTDSSSSAS
jgi:hypothetical protein